MRTNISTKSINRQCRKQTDVAILLWPMLPSKLYEFLGATCKLDNNNSYELSSQRVVAKRRRRGRRRRRKEKVPLNDARLLDLPLVILELLLPRAHRSKVYAYSNLSNESTSSLIYLTRTHLLASLLTCKQSPQDFHCKSLSLCLDTNTQPQHTHIETYIHTTMDPTTTTTTTFSYPIVDLPSRRTALFSSFAPSLSLSLCLSHFVFLSLSLS